jgi:NhaP-type Na+/H+ or K+/H+ antiporter
MDTILGILVGLCLGYLIGSILAAIREPKNDDPVENHHDMVR